MWGNKKPDSPQATTIPVHPALSSAQPLPTPVKPASISASTLPPVEAKKMNPIEAIHPSSSSSTSERNTARLGPSLHVKGEITGNEDLHVDGSVEGLIQLEDRKLTVGASAKVTADVIAREVVVYGNVKGNLRARDRIEIKKDGSVVGDLTTARIMIEDGAYFKGSIEIDRGTEGSGERDLDKPAFARAVTRNSTSD
jgi:cytoskeletal protein CcmA (bactofilin family)